MFAREDLAEYRADGRFLDGCRMDRRTEARAKG
jgi:hypothetical protein